MSEVIQLNEEERNRQQTASERPATIEERNLAGGVPVERPRADAIESSFEDEPEAPVLESELQPTLPTARSVIADLLNETGATMIRLNVAGNINFTFDMFDDAVNAALEEHSSIIIGEQAYNLIQPLNKLNTSNGRIGLLTDRVRDLVTDVANFDDLSGTLVLPVDTSDSVINTLVEARANAIFSKMYEGFDVVDAGEGPEPCLVFGEGSVIPVNSFFYPTFRTLYSVESEGELVTVNVVVETYLRLRIPVLLRTASDKVEATLIRYAKHLQKIAERNGVQSDVFAIFRSADLFKDSVWNLLNIIRENFEHAELLNPQAYSADELATVNADEEQDPVFGTGDILIRLGSELDARESADE